MQLLVQLWFRSCAYSPAEAEEYPATPHGSCAPHHT
jgi:hypothetical protein